MHLLPLIPYHERSSRPSKIVGAGFDVRLPFPTLSFGKLVWASEKFCNSWRGYQLLAVRSCQLLSVASSWSCCQFKSYQPLAVRSYQLLAVGSYQLLSVRSSQLLKGITNSWSCCESWSYQLLEDYRGATSSLLQRITNS